MGRIRVTARAVAGGVAAVAGRVRTHRDRLTVQVGGLTIAVGVGGWVHVWAGLVVGGALAVAYGLLLVDDGGRR